jgi:hypothetical protein
MQGHNRDECNSQCSIHGGKHRCLADAVTPLSHLLGDSSPLSNFLETSLRRRPSRRRQASRRRWSARLSALLLLHPLNPLLSHQIPIALCFHFHTHPFQRRQISHRRESDHHSLLPLLILHSRTPLSFQTPIAHRHFQIPAALPSSLLN